MKKNLVKNLETEIFLVLIGQVLIKYQLSQAEASFKNLEIFDWSKITLDQSKF